MPSNREDGPNRVSDPSLAGWGCAAYAGTALIAFSYCAWSLPRMSASRFHDLAKASVLILALPGLVYSALYWLVTLLLGALSYYGYRRFGANRSLNEHLARYTTISRDELLSTAFLAFFLGQVQPCPLRLCQPLADRRPRDGHVSGVRCDSRVLLDPGVSGI